MKRKILPIVAWIIIGILVIGVVTDALCKLGLNRGLQYAFNFASIFLAIPFLLYIALRDKDL